MPDSAIVNLSPFQAQVYFAIKKHGPLGPSEIGLHCGFIEDASSKVTRPLRKLIKLELIEEHERVNKRRVKYAAINRVDPPFLLMANEEDED